MAKIKTIDENLLLWKVIKWDNTEVQIRRDNLKFVKLYERCWNDSSTKNEKRKKKENIRDFYSSNFQTMMILNYESNVNGSDDDELLLCFVP